MMDEMWMRAWNGSHGRLSVDMDRGFRRLAGGLRRLGQWLAPTSRPGTDSFFARTIVRCGIGAERV